MQVFYVNDEVNYILTVSKKINKNLMYSENIVKEISLSDKPSGLRIKEGGRIIYN